MQRSDRWSHDRRIGARQRSTLAGTKRYRRQNSIELPAPGSPFIAAGGRQRELGGSRRVTGWPNPIKVADNMSSCCSGGATTRRCALSVCEKVKCVKIKNRSFGMPAYPTFPTGEPVSIIRLKRFYFSVRNGKR